MPVTIKQENLNLSVMVSYVDRITIAAISSPGTGITMGMAVCLPEDKFSKEIGRSMAIGRALAAMGNGLVDDWKALSVTEEEWKAKKENKKIKKK